MLLLLPRRKLVPPSHLVEAWPDLYAAGEFWMGQTSKDLLDAVGPLLPWPQVASRFAHATL